MKSRQDRSRKFSGFLDTGTSFTGDLHFEGTVRVDGNVSGSVATPDVLIVGASALVRATITAGAVQIHGRVVGDVRCTGRVEICPGGHLEGNIRTPRLVIEDGGAFEGQSHRVDPATSEETSPAEHAVSAGGGAPGSPEAGDSARPSDLAAGKATPEPARRNLTWKILGRQMALLRTPASAPDDE